MLVKPHLPLPPGCELPSSDDTPVDNENQNFLPNYLLFLLGEIWRERHDWYFGVDMAVHHTSGPNPRDCVVPDGFLSLGVPRRRPSGPRLNYTVWEENNVVPQLALEVVSKTYNYEYDRLKPKDPEKPDAPEEPGKFEIYEKLGVLYYVIYNPEYHRRNRQQPFEIYKLVRGRYELQMSEPCWMPEIGLGLGRSQVKASGLELEVLSWFEEGGDRYLFSEEVADLECQLRRQAEVRAERERQQRDRAEAERDRIEAERDRVKTERDRVKAEKEALLKKLERMRVAGIDPDAF